MSKRNTVRINMDLLDGYLTTKNITPKEFCETRLGFTDGWYYGIRKNGGRGVKVLVAQLIARSIGVEYETLVIDEKDVVKKETINAKLDAGREYGNPSITAGASPRPTETREEKPLFSDYVDMEKELEFRRALLEEARLEIKNAYEQIEELKQEKVNLSFRLEQAEASSCPTERAEELQNEDVRKEREELFEDIDRLIMEKSRLVEQVETKKNELRKIIEAAEKESNGSIIPVHIEDFIEMLEITMKNLTMNPETNLEFLRGQISCFLSLRYYGEKRKEKAKNARPEED